MKAAITLLMLIITTASVAQISGVLIPEESKVVGKVSMVGILIAELSYRIDSGRDTIYTLRYNNAEYQHISDIQRVEFNGAGGAVDTLYKRMKSVFAKENKSKKDYQLSFMLGVQLVKIKAVNNFGRSLYFFADDGYFGILNNQIDKLFGKK